VNTETKEELENYLAKMLAIKFGIISADKEFHDITIKFRNLKIKQPAFSRPNEAVEKELSELSKKSSSYYQMLIIELFNLKEVFDKFLDHQTESEITSLLDSLKTCIDPLRNNFNLIADVRNNIVAHGVIQGKSFRGINHILNDKGISMKDFNKKIYLSTKCATMFLTGFINNSVTYVVKSKDILQQAMNYDEYASEQEYFDALTEARTISEVTISLLKKMNKNREISFVDIT